MNTQILTSEAVSYLTSNPWFVLLLVWSIVWKLIALWKAAKNNHLTIFIVLGFLNTAGILEIIYILYLYFKSKKNQQPEQLN